MTEPIYEFIRGQGWVANGEPPVLVSKNGKTYRVEMRKPEPGEFCCYDMVGSPDCYTPERWAGWFKTVYNQYTYDQLKSDIKKPGLSWVTFVEVS
jgi:hypothetical protein